MKTFPGIDYEQRPESYWEDENVLAALLRDVKGTNRRRMIMDYWNAGQIEELNGELLQGKIPEELRQRLGRMDPSFMGGEYSQWAAGQGAARRIARRRSVVRAPVDLDRFRWRPKRRIT